MSTISINGQRVVSGSIAIPMHGPWVADVVLSLAEPLTPAASIVIGNLTLVGTVYRMASFAGSKSARVVGGAGGWRKPLPARGYSHDAGVLASTVMTDAARESGETIVVDQDRQLGTSWARDAGKAEGTLKLITGGIWWIDPAGVTQTRARDASLISTPFTAIAWSGGKGQFEIATEFYSDWQPGRTFNAPTIGSVQTVSSVRFDATNNGKLRLIVLSAASESDRATASIRNLIRSELASMLYCAPWEYTIAAGTSSKADLVSSDPRMPDLTNVPYAPGLLGEKVTPAPGSLCTVAFINADPARARIVGIEGTPLLSEINATLIRLAGGVRPTAAMGDLAGPFPIVATGIKVLV